MRSRYRLTWTILAAALTVTVWAAPAAAQQNGGQFCVRAFEDLNGNQVRDPGEPLIQSGITANLQDADGVIIAIATMEESSTRAQGLICFRDLPAGQYGVFVTTATFTPTTVDNITGTIGPGQLPAVLEYGAQRIEAAAAPVIAAEDPTNNTLERLLIAALGGVTAMIVVALIGFALFWFFVRPRRPAQPAGPVDPYARYRPPQQRSTGTVPRYDDAGGKSSDPYEDYQEFR